MGASRIQGITVEIGGDTTRLATVLKSVNTDIQEIMCSLPSRRTASMSLKCGAVPGAAQKWTPLRQKVDLAAIPKVIRR